MLNKHFFNFLKYQDYFFGMLSCRAMQLKGYSQHPVHPKHLFDEDRSLYLHNLFRSGILFLDIGSGVGTDCILAAKHGANIAVGLEKNIESILAAVQRKKRQQINSVSFIQIDLESGILPFVDDLFDIINFTNVLEHIDNRQAVLSELKRVKKRDGVAVISVPNADTAWKRKQAAAGLDFRDDPDHKIEYSRQSLTEEMRKADLEIYSELMPIVPSWPWNGLIAMSAFFSPKLYKKMQCMKRNYVEKHPEESIGWIFAAR